MYKTFKNDNQQTEIIRKIEERQVIQKHSCQRDNVPKEYVVPLKDQDR